MNTKRTLRVMRQIVREYDEGRLMGSMRQFVATLRNLLVTSGPDCEDLIKQSLRILLADMDRSPLNLIPGRHLQFLRGMVSRDLVGSGLKRTVMDLISEGSYTKSWVLQQFSELLAEMHDLGARLKSLEHHLSMLGISVEDIPEDRAIINAAIVPDSVTSAEHASRMASLVEMMRSLCSLSGGRVFSVEVQAEDRADSVLSFTVERSTASLFCVIYLGILDTYAYISNFDTQIANLKSLKTSKGVIRVLEKEKKRMLNERLVVSTNIALSEFFKSGEYSQKTFAMTHALLVDLILKVEDGFDFDVELGPQTDLVQQTMAADDKLVQYLFAINRFFPGPRKGLRHLIDRQQPSEKALPGQNAPVSDPDMLPRQSLDEDAAVEVPYEPLHRETVLH